MNAKSTFLIGYSAILVEWCEFSIYIYMSTILSKIFFPPEMESYSLMLTFAIFAASYIVRPFGAIIYGYIADKHGRRPVMVVSVLLMSFGTVGIGCLPIYGQVGMIAPILLLILRMLQGFAIAVEFNNSANYLIEHSQKRPILVSSLISVTGTGGMCLGALIVSSIDFSEFSWMWRVPFLVIGLYSFVIYVYRRSMKESPEFLYIKEKNLISKNPLLEVLKSHKPALIAIVILSAFIGVFLYGGHIYLVSYLVNYGGYSLKLSSKLAFYTELGLTVFIPIFAFIGEKYKIYHKLFDIGTIALGITCPFLFLIGKMGPENIHLLYLALFSYVISDALFSTAVFYYMYCLLPPQIRCSGTGLAYSVSIAFFGGTAPFVSEVLVSNGFYLGPGIYITILSVITFITINYCRNKNYLEADFIKRKLIRDCI